MQGSPIITFYHNTIVQNGKDEVWLDFLFRNYNVYTILLPSYILYAYILCYTLDPAIRLRCSWPRIHRVYGQPWVCPASRKRRFLPVCRPSVSYRRFVFSCEPPIAPKPAWEMRAKLKKPSTAWRWGLGACTITSLYPPGEIPEMPIIAICMKLDRMRCDMISMLFSRI